MSFSFEGLREGAATCPSDYALDLLFAGETEHETKRELERHIFTCAVCKTRMETRRAGFQAFPAFDEKRLLAEIEARGAKPHVVKKARVSFVLGTFGVMAALALALLMVRPTSQEGTDDTTRLKGGLALRVHRLRDGRSEEVLSGAAFASGDRIRFQVSTPVPGLVAILGTEANGTLYTAWPDGLPARALPTTQNVLLDGAVELDDASGRETLWLVLCEGAGTPSACRSRGPELAPDCPVGCTSTPFVMEKGP